MALKVTLAVALLAALCTGQQLQGNYVDDYQDYQEAPQRAAPPPPRPAPQRHSGGHSSSNAPRPTPVPILKQINRHNEDGSYTYGYEGADGTFKIETKFPSGDVKGKYGFVDDTGKVRVVEYGADRYGFQPAGEGITVAPPTLVDETTREDEEVERPRPRPSAPARFENRPPPPPPPRYESRPPAPAPAPAPARFDNYEVQSRFQDEPRYAPRPKSPTPPRPLAVPGASPVGGPPPQRPLLVPGGSPVSQSRPAPRPQPQVSRAFQPAQQFGPQHFAGHVQQPVRQQQSGGILDQLAKDYALPKGAGTPLHDISFGYY